MGQRMIEQNQIKAIWASAREYGLDKQTVYDVIQSISGQEHMTKLSYLQAAKVLGVIHGVPLAERQEQKRTDTGGEQATVPLRRKIYCLTGELGWNDDNRRINGFVKKMFRVERIEWLSVQQCHKLIEILKQMLAERAQKAK